MRNLSSFGVCVLLATILSAATAAAQQVPAPRDVMEEVRARQEKEREEERARLAKEREEAREYQRRTQVVIPLDVQVVVSRFQGDKKLSSLPYSLVVNAVHTTAIQQLAQIRMGAKVPLPSTAAPTVDGKPVTGMLTSNPVQYQEIGTFIDAHAKWLEDGGFELHVSVSDTSLYKRSPNAPASAEQIDDMGLPVLRTFTAANKVVMKDGQTKQFMLAADRISGDTLRVDVTLKVAR